MEPDRYEQNHAYFIAGIVGLILSMALFGLCLYLLPNLIFDIHYAIPDSVVDLYSYMMSNYQFPQRKAQWVVFFIIFGFASIAALIAYFASNHIDNQIYHTEKEDQPTDWDAKKRRYQDSGRMVLRIVLIVAFVFAISMLFQWAVSPPSQPNY